jgi:hypothetical protein
MIFPLMRACGSADQSDEDCKQRRARNSPAKREQSRHQHAQNEAAGGRADEGRIGAPHPVLPTAEESAAR